MKQRLVEYLAPARDPERAASEGTTALAFPGMENGWPLRKAVNKLELMAEVSREPGVLRINELILARGSEGAVTVEVPMQGLELPRIAGLSVEVGSAAPLEVARKIRPWKSVLATVLAQANGCIAYVAQRADTQAILLVGRQRDRDGGRAAGTGFRSFTPEKLIERLMAGDKNGDGKLTKEELRSVLQPRFATFDRNRDGVLDRDEIRKMAEFLGARRQR